MGFPGGSDSKESACNAETQVWSLVWEDPLEKEMATHSSILTWRIPWTEEPGTQGHKELTQLINTFSLKSLTWQCYPTVNLLLPSPTYKCFLNLQSSLPIAYMTAFKCSTSISHSICLKLTHYLPYQTRPFFFNFSSPTLGLPWCFSG